jgi:hypothetical protein
MQAFDLAAGLASQDGGAVDVLVPASDRIDGTRRGVDAVVALQARGLAAQVRAVGRPSTLLAALPGDGVLVVSAEAGVTVDELPCSAVVVR